MASFYGKNHLDDDDMDMDATNRHEHNDDENDDELHIHNNYIDYSCSTSIERLARDVETILHSWHVDAGSDRHFSSSMNNTQNETTISPTKIHRPKKETSPLLLRSETLTWDLSFRYTEPSLILPHNKNSTAQWSHPLPPPPAVRPKERVECHIELRLDLWDRPPMMINASKRTRRNTTSDMDDDIGGDDEDDEQQLPYSLQRRQHDHISDVDDWFNQFSTLFGIGQHITLTPTNPDCFFLTPSSSIPKSTSQPQQQQIDMMDDDDDDTAATSKYSVPTTATYQSLSTSQQNTTIATATTTKTILNPSYKPLLQYLTHVILYNNSSSAAAATGTSRSSPGIGDIDNHIQTRPTMILSSWLQTALNISVSHCDCQIPIFGIWGNYSPTTTTTSSSGNEMRRRIQYDELSLLPTWMQVSYEIRLLPELVARYQKLHRSMALLKSKQQQQQQRQKQQSRSSEPILRTQQLPTSLLSAQPHISGHVWSSCSSATTSFCCTTMQPLSNQQPYYYKWNIWGDILQQYSRSTGSPSTSSSSSSLSTLVHLCRAKHTYMWKKQRPLSRGGNIIWQALSSTINHEYNKEIVREWRSQHSWISPMSNNIDDCTVAESMYEYIRQCQQYVTLLIEQALGRRDDDDEPLCGPNDDPVDYILLNLCWSSQQEQPLLTLPLQSRHSMSARDWEEMVRATESAILDPYRAQHSNLEVVYDPDVTHATLATTQRCVLAALIRTATLPKETLISQLFDGHTINLWDNSAGNRAAKLLSRKARVDKSTRSLVDAMDWQHASIEMIERYEAENIVRNVLNGNDAYGFPSPPDNIVSALAVDFASSTSENDTSFNNTWNVWKPLRKSAPPGRLLSLLFLQMSRVRSPSSMAMVWSVFVDELRRRLDARESLPNMSYIPGFDPSPAELINVDSSRSCFLSVGTKANLAALVNASEPDPDDFHCLIGQKLQVFNICIENMTSFGMCQAKISEQCPQRQSEIVEWDSSDQREEKKLSPNSKTLLNGSVIDGLPLIDGTETMKDESDRDDSSRSTITQEFYDAVDVDLLMSPNKAGKRMGARCPIQGLILTDSGDQMYAPYLQRPHPVTDDVVAERLLILSRQNKEPNVGTIQQRLEIAHRFQKPKLLSDMRSFKAANPGATFTDFSKWYGNPEDGLSFLENSLSAATSSRTTDEIDAFVQGENWILARDASRNFWLKTWNDANAASANEQEPLFDAESTLEVALDFLENIHPAALIGQVVAVNLAMSYYVVAASAGEIMQLPTIREKIDRLHDVTVETLQHLSSDSTKLIDNITYQNNDPDAKTFDKAMYVTSITACNRVCEMIASTEFIVSRAKSLLHKLPKQYDLVESILIKSDFSVAQIKDEATLSEMLNTISNQQRHFETTTSEIKATPIVRQYMLRNVDDKSPCQLCVRTHDEGMKVLGLSQHGRTILALTRTIRETL